MPLLQPTSNPTTSPIICDPLTIENPSFETTGDWTVVANGAEQLDASYWNPDEGSYSIDMNAGSISQELATTEGCTYKIAFAMSNNPAAQWCGDKGNDAGVEKPTIFVSAVPSVDETPILRRSDTAVPQLFPTLNWPGVVVYETKEFEFIATSSLTTLKFDSMTYNDDGNNSSRHRLRWSHP